MKIAVDFKHGNLIPRFIRVGQRVYQRLNPQHQGTVVQSDAAGFTVAYDAHDRQPRERRVRQWFPISRAWDFVPGTPDIRHEVVAPSDEP